MIKDAHTLRFKCYESDKIFILPEIFDFLFKNFDYYFSYFLEGGRGQGGGGRNAPLPRPSRMPMIVDSAGNSDAYDKISSKFSSNILLVL